MALLSLQNISFSYGKTPVLKDISYDFEKGKMYCIIGKSGAGKTTLLSLLSGLATPLALLSLGAQFEFSAIKELKKEIIFGTVARTVIVPLICLSIAYFAFRNLFSGAHFAAFVALFATPLAVSTVPMTQEMNGDSDLAGQIVVWSTIVSGFTIFLTAFILKAVGVF